MRGYLRRCLLADPQIIKGSYPPMPATRSRELRELCDRMLTLDWNKRPSINEILATPLLKARIQKFLGATLQVLQTPFWGVEGLPQGVCSGSNRALCMIHTHLPTDRAGTRVQSHDHPRPAEAGPAGRRGRTGTGGTRGRAGCSCRGRGNPSAWCSGRPR